MVVVVVVAVGGVLTGLIVLVGISVRLASTTCFPSAFTPHPHLPFTSNLHPSKNDHLHRCCLRRRDGLVRLRCVRSLPSPPTHQLTPRPPLPRSNTVDDIAYEVDAKMIVISDGDVDIGANPSAEEQEEALENGGQQVNNIVHSFRLTPTQFDKKSYLTYLKGYMKKLKSTLAERAEAGDAAAKERLESFESKAQAFAKKLIGNFKDYEFFIGESMDPEGMVVLMNYREDGVTPYMIYWKDGLKEASFRDYPSFTQLGLLTPFLRRPQMKV